MKGKKLDQTLPNLNKFHQYDFTMPGSNVHFVQGIPVNIEVKGQIVQQDSDNDSVISASS